MRCTTLLSNTEELTNARISFIETSCIAQKMPPVIYIRPSRDAVYLTIT